MTYEDMKLQIELACNYDEVMSLRDYLEEEYDGEYAMKLSRMLTAKELQYEMMWNS